MSLTFLHYVKHKKVNVFRCNDCGHLFHLKTSDQLDLLENNGCTECKKRQSLHYFRTA